MLIKTFKPKLVIPEPLERHPGTSFGLRGEVRAVLLDLNLRPVFDTGWTPNLITNYGMAGLAGGGGAGLYMHIGDSAVSPVFTDVSLGNWLAYAQTIRLGRIQAVAPDYGYSTQVKGRFNPGVATGWVREMGMAQSTTDDPSTIAIRALLNPAIEKGPDNYLDIYHRLWVYPDKARNTTQITVNGEIFDCTAGNLNLDTWSDNVDTYVSHHINGSSVSTYGAPETGGYPFPALDEGMATTWGTDNTWPRGIGLVATGGASPQWWADSEAYLALEDANFTYGIGGVGALYDHHPGGAGYTFVSTVNQQGIPKDETMRFRLRVRTTIERYTP